MIKGVNRQVLEIHDTGNRYFEKALLFVKPEYSTLGEARLRTAAQNTFGVYDKIPQCRNKKIKGIALRMAAMLFSALFGALTAFYFSGQ